MKIKHSEVLYLKYSLNTLHSFNREPYVTFVIVPEIPKFQTVSSYKWTIILKFNSVVYFDFVSFEML